jgi:hypothetical protein
MSLMMHFWCLGACDVHDLLGFGEERLTTL